VINPAVAKGFLLGVYSKSVTEIKRCLTSVENSDESGARFGLSDLRKYEAEWTEYDRFDGKELLLYIGYLRSFYIHLATD